MAARQGILKPSEEGTVQEDEAHPQNSREKRICSPQENPEDFPPETLRDLELPGLVPQSSPGTRMMLASIGLDGPDLLNTPPLSFPQNHISTDVRAESVKGEEGEVEERAEEQGPVISHFAGTTKGVPMVRRPQPPPKPRCERPFTTNRKLCTSVKVPGPETKAGGSCSHSSSHWHVHSHVTPSDPKHLNKNKAAVPAPSTSTTHGLKSTAELLMEAQIISGVRCVAPSIKPAQETSLTLDDPPSSSGSEKKRNPPSAAGLVFGELLGDDYLTEGSVSSGTFGVFPPRVFKPCSPPHGLPRQATRTPEADMYYKKTIHHLCTSRHSEVLPVELQLVSRACHSSNQFGAVAQRLLQRAALVHCCSAQVDQHRTVTVERPCAALSELQQKVFAANPSPQAPETLPDWKRIAGYYVETPQMMLHGQSAQLCDSELKMFWKPAPPKLSCTPSYVRDKLFPKYQPAGRVVSGGNQQLVHLSRDPPPSEPSSCTKNIIARKCRSLLDIRAEESAPPISQLLPQTECLKRSVSSPQLCPATDTSLRVQCDFSSVTRELEVITQQLLASSQPKDPSIKLRNLQQTLPLDPQEPTVEPTGLIMSTQVQRCQGQGKGHRRHHKRAQRGKKLSQAKMAYVQQKLKEPPRKLFRSESLWILPQKPKTRPQWHHLPRRPSLPPLLDFQSFVEKQGDEPDMVSSHEWVRDIWKAWTNEGPSLDRVDLSQTLEQGLTMATLEQEVAKLTDEMAKQRAVKAFDLCRRGALYTKLGHLSKALEDLNAAISLEPHLLDAYWHRHRVYLLKNNQQDALYDLNFIIERNKRHADALESRAEIYRTRGEVALAIINYTQAIKCRPHDGDIYFRRAEMYERQDKMSLAMEDYAAARRINPHRTDALMKRGLYHFNSSNWAVALDDFTSLLQQEPRVATAWTYRGRICMKMGRLQEAVEYFSLAIHLDPNNWLAFHYRGCLLRKSLPEQALRDLSVSVLINDHSENISAFLHRGLVYSDQRQWRKALLDFEAVIKLDRGLIYMLHLEQNGRAVRMFSKALSADPTCSRAYACRARAFHKLNDLRRALKDVTSAIHLTPDVQDLHVMRCLYLCDMKHFTLANVSVQYAVQMNEGLASSPMLQATVSSFLGDDAQAIGLLVEATQKSFSAPILIQLGKLQMKAQSFMEAADSFMKAIGILSSDSLSNHHQTAEPFYLIGLCYIKQHELQQAVIAFSKAIKVNPCHAEAYHQRGVCHARLQQPESLQDLNRSLTIDPSLFQVYLSRAAFYGAKGFYSKAILNCNEAISIQPNSTRAYLYRGALKIRLKAYKGAVEDLSVATAIDQTCSFAYYNRGLCYQLLRNHKLALRDYGITLLLPGPKQLAFKTLVNRALLYTELNDPCNALEDFLDASDRSPEDAAIHHALGVYHHRLGQLQESVKAYTQAMRFHPFFLEAYVGRGNALMDYGHNQARKQAQRDYLSALHLDPLCQSARICLAYNFQVFGRFQWAWNQFTVAAELTPRNWAAFEGRAVVNLQMGSMYAAFQDISSALKLNPLSEQLFTNRGVINQLMGDKVNAMRDYKKAISLIPSYALAYFNAANLYFYNRQFEQACEYYSRAVELDPQDESALLNRAITLSLLRKVPEALSDFSLALELNPSFAHVFLNRANLYCSLKEYQLAEKDLNDALRLQPSDALLYKLRSEVRGHLGLTQQALQDYETALELHGDLET
ncbi:uncharacterized protein ttc6 isoform X3 [Denticeps clupeoides]|nr:tetratricopeptide repeat protein 6 isoform X3 [Denticeps clupeoides]